MKSIAFLSHVSGLNRLRRLVERAIRGPFLTVLAYHRVNDVEPDDSLYTVSTAQFAEHARYLRDNFNVVTFAEVLEMKADPEAARDALVLSLDDGYEDNFTNAAPILEDCGLKACFFLTTDLMDAASEGRLVEGDFPGMTWEQARDLRRRGFEVGVHTCSHPNLARLPLEEARREILSAKARTEEMLGEPVRYFAYPGGKWGTHANAAVAGIVAQEFSVCCTTMRGRNPLRTMDMLAVNRIAVHNWWSSFHFARELEGTFDFLPLLGVT
ncbi:MAG: polysaccharide deacetylase family protein [Planctomycetota bacterium]|jgi:peptidoglycan/xylan/chitin deacetylase (PgdA/CDA1 family)